MKTKRGEPLNSSSMNKVLLKQSYIKKLNIILTEESIIEKETYNLIRNFFKEYLNLDYEFTNEEMKKELKQVYFSMNLKERISTLFDTLSKIEYLSQPLSQSQLKNLLINFKSIIDDLVVVHYQEELSFIKKMQHSLQTFLTNKRNLVKKNSINKKDVKNKALTEIENKKTNIIPNIDDLNIKEMPKEEFEQPPTETLTPAEESKESVDSLVELKESVQVKEVEIPAEYSKEKKLVTKIKPKKIKEKQINQIKTKTIKKEFKANIVKKSPRKNKETKDKVKIQSRIKKLGVEDKINKDLGQLNSLINKDFKQAKLLYFAILRLYNSLDDSKKDKYFEDIQKAYTQLQNKSR